MTKYEYFINKAHNCLLKVADLESDLKTFYFNAYKGFVQKANGLTIEQAFEKIDT